MFNRFMLVFIMFISYQACLVCKNISKSCPHDQFVLNYGLRTKLYIARISEIYSKFEGPISTGQVRSPPPLPPPVDWTSPAKPTDKSSTPGI
jgi:hypothetical protein